MRRNRHALDCIALRPRVCRDVSQIDTSTTLFGRKWRMPVALAPVGSLESFHPGRRGHRRQRGLGVRHPDHRQFGDASGAGGNRRRHDRGRKSSSSMCAATTPGATTWRSARWPPATTRSPSPWTPPPIRGASATSPGRFVKPWRAAATGHNFQAGFTWDNVKHFKDKHSIPLILKGIATAEDAALGCEHGVDGVYVSNHGGRQLDHGRGSMDVLPEVMAAVRGRAKVIIDGSICRGTDIVKAIALGADAVAMGRMYCYALAADGDAGVHKMLELLEHEFGVAMALAGARSLGELHPGFVFRDAPQVAQPHAHSAFPLLQTTPEFRG